MQTKILLFLGVLLAYTNSTLLAQSFENPSFEGPRGDGDSPPSWRPCHPWSTPDTQPGSMNVSTPASHGNTYVGMVTRGNLGPYANENEDIQTQLTEPIGMGNTFTFAIDLAFAEDGGHEINWGADWLSYGNPAKLQVYGGTNSCDKTELLWESPTVNHTDWQTYLVTVIPESIEVNYLIFRVENIGSNNYFGNILLDNIQECAFEVDWPNDSTICETGFMVLDAYIPNGTYVWQDGTTEPTFTVNSAGTYGVTISNACTSKYYEIEVQTRNCYCDVAVPIRTVSFDTTICAGTSVELNARTPSGQYLWNTGWDQEMLIAQSPGLYTVDVSNRCETETFEFRVQTKDCSCAPVIPEAFSPNGDGINDTFEVYLPQMPQRYTLTIFTRAGQELFKTDWPLRSWDGTYNGRPMPDGIYFYSLVLDCYNIPVDTEQFYKGTISLIR